MRIWSRTRKTWVVAGALVGVVIIILGVVLVVRGDRVPPAAPASPAVPAGTASIPTPPATTVVNVFFHRGTADDPTEVVPVRRVVPKTPRVATAAVNQLLGGPTVRETEAGYWSVFVPATANTLRSVRIANGVAHVDFHDFSGIIPNASSSFGSAALMAELDSTLKQFSSVRSTVYSFDGNVDAFYLWLQLTPPTTDQGTPPEAMRAARDFLTDVVGMKNPVDGPFRRTGDGTATATFYPRSPTGHPVPAQATVVSLRRGGDTWQVTATTTGTIVVAEPAPRQIISSPLRVSGRAHTFEGMVNVHVLQIMRAATPELGSGAVVGGGDQLRPFSGDITFRTPLARTGWVLFTELSAANGDVVRATSVPVGFSGRPQAPDVRNVGWQPRHPVVNGWLKLPAGTGTVTFTVVTQLATRVDFYLTPTGTATDPPVTGPTTPIGSATRKGDLYTFAWTYRDEPLLARLLIAVVGPGGRIELQPFGVYHG